jgi:hypothetical protein
MQYDITRPLTPIPLTSTPSQTQPYLHLHLDR